VEGSSGSDEDREVEAAEQGLSALFMKAHFYSRRVFDEAMRPHGVSGPQAGVLNRIYKHPGISGIEISRQMFTTPQAVQIMLATLERLGLIERRPDPNNGRVVQAFLSDEGMSVILACRAAAIAVDRKLREGFNEEERTQLVNLLERFLDQAVAERADRGTKESDRGQRPD
jgi:DNA-binding MarR family transcriptional regulator